MTVLAFAGLATAAAAQTPDATLPSNCLDQQIGPSSVILACGDAGFIAQDLVWSDWGAAQASATGTASVNTCDPDCATGAREEYPVTLTASELRDCDYGAPQYTLVTYAFPAASPYPPESPGSENPTVEFRCPVRPHADPKIKRMRMTLTGHGPPGDSYFVRVDVRLRICAVRGIAEVVFNETKRAGGYTFGRHTGAIKFRQRSRCEKHRFKWRLRDKFFGVGTYSVKATAWDKDSQFSKTVSRKKVTAD